MRATKAEEGLATEVASLEGLDIAALREDWRRRWAAPPPPVRSADFLRRLLAERLQLQAFGGDPDLDRQLAELVKRYRRGRGVKLPRHRIKAGTLMVREHKGRVHQVEVLDTGYAWNGKIWRSLSEIAREITGIRWNGPRFFGLRNGKAAA